MSTQRKEWTWFKPWNVPNISASIFFQRETNFSLSLSVVEGRNNRIVAGLVVTEAVIAIIICIVCSDVNNICVCVRAHVCVCVCAHAHVCVNRQKYGHFLKPTREKWWPRTTYLTLFVFDEYINCCFSSILIEFLFNQITQVIINGTFLMGWYKTTYRFLAICPYHTTNNNDEINGMTSFGCHQDEMWAWVMRLMVLLHLGNNRK